MKPDNFRSCVTCKHHEAVFDTSALHYCVKDVPPAEFCPVTGAGWKSVNAKPCFVRRVSDHDECGPEGKCHEPIY